MRQIFWSSSNDFPDDVESAIQKVTLDTMELGAGEKAAMSLNCPERVCDRLRSCHPLVALSSRSTGEETRERRNLSLVFADAHTQSGTLEDPAGPGAHLV